MGPLGIGPRMDPESILGLFPGCIMFAFRLSIRLKTDGFKISFLCRDWNYMFATQVRKLPNVAVGGFAFKASLRFVLQFFQMECNSIQILVSVLWLEMHCDAAPEGAENASWGLSPGSCIANAFVLFVSRLVHKIVVYALAQLILQNNHIHGCITPLHCDLTK